MTAQDLHEIESGMTTDDSYAEGLTTPPLTTGAKVWWVARSTVVQVAITCAPLVVAAVIWQCVAISPLVHPALFPPLQDIFRAIGQMAAEGELWSDIGQSVRRLLIAVVIGIVIGTFLGLMMGTRRWAERSLAPLMNFGLATPGIALIPLAILWFGLSDMTIMSILIAEVVLVTMLNTWSAVKSVELRLIDAARTMGVGGWEMFWRILLPASLNGIISGYRLAFSRGWRVLVAGEMLAGVAGGLGYRIYEARQNFQSDRVYAGILVIGLLGLLLERVVLRTLENATVERWGATRELER